MRSNTELIWWVLFLCLAIVVSATNAQTYSAPVGVMRFSVPAQSDYALGVPLHRPVEYQGTIQSISGNTITVADTPGWSSNQFVYAAGTQAKTYFVRIDSGTKEGEYATVTANDASSLTLTPNTGDDLTGILTNANDGAGDLISVIPYWTPSTLFSSGATVGIQLLIMPTTSPGINLSASVICGFNGTNWKHGLSIADDIPLAPLVGMILRNENTASVSLTMSGNVPMAEHRMLLSTLADNTQQDIWFYYNSPVPEIIGNIFTDPSTHAATTTLTAGDQVYAFSNSGGFNQGASYIVSWSGSAWLHHGSNVTNTYQFIPGYAYILRKSATATPTTSVWSALQSYLSP